jgi:hypothetical protein
VASIRRHPKTFYKLMAKRAQKKLKWWKNSSTLFLVIVLSIPAIILVTSIGLVAQRASHIRPSFTPTAQPATAADFRFVMDATTFVAQGKQIVLYGLTHTHNVLLNSAAGRMQEQLAAPAKALAKLGKKFNINDSHGMPSRLAIPGAMLAELSLTSDRRMAYIMNNYASRFKLAYNYHLTSPDLIKIREQLGEMTKSLGTTIHPVVVGN